MIPYINFVEPINDDVAKRLMNLCCELWDQQKPTRVVVLFSSPGGFINPGVSLYNFFQAFPCEIIMHNIGNIDSSAVIVFLAGNRRLASPSSSFLMHGITWNYRSGAVRTREQLEEDLSRLKEDEARIAKILASKTKLTIEEVMSLFRQGEAKSPEFALEKGIIDSIEEPKIPTEAQILHL